MTAPGLSPSHRAVLDAHRAGAASPAEVAARTMIPLGTVRVRLSELRGMGLIPAALTKDGRERAPNGGAAAWTDAELDALMTMWRDGHSAGTISRALPGRSRNAVVGVVHRLALQRGEGASSRARTPRPQPRRVRPSFGAPSSRARQVPEEIESAREASRREADSIIAAFDAPVLGSRSALRPQNIARKAASRAFDPGLTEAHEPAPPGGVTLMDARHHHCRWPSGDPRTDAFRFCGATVAREGGSWCAEHRARAYQPGRSYAPARPIDGSVARVPAADSVPDLVETLA